jgi:hypothetical protein
VAFEQLGALERAIGALQADAGRYRAGSADDIVGLSCAAYLGRLTLPSAVRDFLIGWWAVVGGTRPEDGAVVDALASIAAHGGVVGLLASLRFTPVEGWSTLAERFSATPGVQTRLEAPVSRIRQLRDAVEVTGPAGALRARHVVVAVPVNALTGIELEPPLPTTTAEAVGANAGRAIKLCLLASGVPPGSLAAGAGEGLAWLIVDRALGDDSLLTGFGWDDNVFDPNDAAHVARALRAFFPGARLEAWDWHDWNADPWSRGTWATAAPGKAELLRHDRFPPFGRICFASSDVARHDPGWIVGALVAGGDAARWVLDEHS